jgi:hypothetical protein
MKRPGLQAESSKINLTVQGREKRKLARRRSVGQNCISDMALRDILSPDAAETANLKEPVNPLLCRQYALPVMAHRPPPAALLTSRSRWMVAPRPRPASMVESSADVPARTHRKRPVSACELSQALHPYTRGAASFEREWSC